MNGELMPYVQGQARVPLEDRRVAKEAKGIYDETRVDVFRFRALGAEAKEAMNEVKSLDDHRRELAGDDTTLNVILGEIETAAVQGVAHIIRSRAASHDTSGWRF